MVKKPSGQHPASAPGDVIARFEVQRHSVLDAEGVPVGPLPEFARDGEHLLHLYRTMCLVRAFDRRAIALQRTGQLGTYASCLGQEAVGAAVGDAMQATDVLLPTYREHAAQLLRGLRMRDVLLYWGGDERGMAYAGLNEDFPTCVPIGTQALHAVGVAAAFSYRREARVAVCTLGDGGTSRGDFHEAMNLAGTWRLPIVFVVVNNQWAISVRRELQTGSGTLAQKAIAAGFDGEQVDGNDVIALRERIARAIARARRGEGPHLLEALTYRLGDHTTADDAARYREAEEVERQSRLEPLIRLRTYLEKQGMWDAAREAALQAQCQQEVEDEVKAYLATPAPPPEAMFDYLYAQLPRALAAQRGDAGTRGGGHG